MNALTGCSAVGLYSPCSSKSTLTLISFWESFSFLIYWKVLSVFIWNDTWGLNALYFLVLPPTPKLPVYSTQIISANLWRQFDPASLQVQLASQQIRVNALQISIQLWILIQSFGVRLIISFLKVFKCHPLHQFPVPNQSVSSLILYSTNVENLLIADILFPTVPPPTTFHSDCNYFFLNEFFQPPG